MSKTMRAMVLDGDHLVVHRVARPELSPGCVRLRIRAAGVNRADLVQRAGRYAPPPGASPLLGLEAVGHVIEVHPSVDHIDLGDRRVALLAGGGYAEEVVVRADHTLPVPPDIGDHEAAAFIEVFATAWLNLQWEGGLDDTTGRRVLLHAGGSGVGTAAVQICRLLGHRAFVTAGSDDKIRRCIDLGAEAGANRHEGPWLPKVKAWAPDGVDMVLDPVGADYLEPNLKALALEGRMVSIGLLSGRAAQLDMGRLLVRRLRLVGSTLRSRSDDFKARLLRELGSRLVPAWERREVRAMVDRAFSIEEADAAHAYLASNKTFGALVLQGF